VVTHRADPKSSTFQEGSRIKTQHGSASPRPQPSRIAGAT